MPLDYDFRQHLHDVMVEVSTSLHTSEAAYKAEVTWKARQTRNAAAIPLAYKDAALHALVNRFDQTVDRYFQALDSWDIELDPSSEKELLLEINMLTAGPSTLQFPPAMQDGQHLNAVQQAYARERQSIESQLRLKAANRLREWKAKRMRKPPLQGQVFNTTFNAPVNTALINSSQTVVHTISASALCQLEAVSKGNTILEETIQEVKQANSEKKSVAESLGRWVTLANAIEGLAEKAYEHYPAVVALLHSLKPQ